MIKLNTEVFINKAKQIHGDKYDYSKVVYEKSQIKVCIICPKHGEFWQTPNNHLSGKGCPECKKEKLHNLKVKEQSKFIEQANKIHNNKYDYSKVDYINQKTKVCIICPKHGEFWQTPNNHLNGKGCPKCVNRGYQYGLNRKCKTLDIFKNEANTIHKNFYDYSKSIYKNANIKLCIICPKHGEFWQSPSKHLHGQGCPICANDKKHLTLNEFLIRANNMHNNFYNYSKVNFTSVCDYITITCPIHGDFTQNVMSHLRGHGCQTCNASLMEKDIERILKDNSIKYIPQCNSRVFSWLGLQSLDFYLPDYKIAIECQGEQHFHSVDFSGVNEARAIEEFNNCVERDGRKKRKCEENGVRLLYFTKKKFFKKGDNVIEGEYFFNPKKIIDILNGKGAIYKKVSEQVTDGDSDKCKSDE